MLGVHHISAATVSNDITCVLHQWKLTTANSLILPSQKYYGIRLWMQTYANRTYGNHWYWENTKDTRQFPWYIVITEPAIHGDCLSIE